MSSVNQESPPPGSSEAINLSTAESLVDGLLNHAITLGSTKGIEAADLEALYSEAYDKLIDGRADDALEDLLLLVTHEPWDRRFQFAYGLALQSLDQWAAASTHYAQALLLDATDAGCLLRIAECLEAQGEIPDATEALRDCILLSWQDPQWHLVRAHAQAALTRLDDSKDSK